MATGVTGSTATVELVTVETGLCSVVELGLPQPQAITNNKNGLYFIFMSPPVVSIETECGEKMEIVWRL